MDTETLHALGEIESRCATVALCFLFEVAVVQNFEHKSKRIL